MYVSRLQMYTIVMGKVKIQLLCMSKRDIILPSRTVSLDSTIEVKLPQYEPAAQ